MGSIVRWLFTHSARGLAPALLNIGSMSPPVIPRHGCIPAEPASVSPGRFIVAPLRDAVLNFRLARHSGAIVALTESTTFSVSGSHK
jgi:hypothetical protein